MNNSNLNIASFTIVTLNCKEMNNNTKREKIFNILKANYADIICLQETNTNPNLSDYLINSWHLNASWNYYTAILINNPKINSVYFSSSSNGRILNCKFQLQQKLFNIFNIYAPPDKKNRLLFWQKFKVNYQKEAYNFIVGDFNTILDPERDRCSLSQYIQDPSARIIQQKLSNLSDSYSFLNKLPNFTFYSSTSSGQFKGKLDYIFSDMSPSFYYKSKIFYMFSDHLALIAIFKSIIIQSFSNTSWKLNNKCLEIKELRERIIETLSSSFPEWDNLKFLLRNILIQNKKRTQNPANSISRLTRDIKRLSLILKSFSETDDIRSIITKKQEQSQILAQ